MKAYLEKWKSKSKFSKITDFIFIALIIAMLIPQSRMAIGAFINGIKAKVIQPAVIDEKTSTQIKSLDFEMTDLKGEEVNLSDFQGKVIFINFWATWCPPCVGEMPGIQTLYDKYKDNPDIKFVIFSNENPETIKSFIQKKEYTFPVYYSDKTPPAEFATEAIPATFLISKTGKITIKEIGASNWGGEKMFGIVDDLLK